MAALASFDDCHPLEGQVHGSAGPRGRVRGKTAEDPSGEEAQAQVYKPRGPIVY